MYEGMQKDKVNVFINYIKSLKKDDKTAWSKTVSENDFEAIFKKVASTGMYIDGESITLASLKGKLVVNYDYHAYKNKVLLTYPETIFDFGIVYEGDEYSFAKESGKVSYSHKMNNPFKTDKVIIGAYGIIKNSRGEFVETINMQDIDKMKKTSKMSFIWDSWFDRMVLKSVIKRICSVNFKDIIQDIDSIDNESNDPNRVSISQDILDELELAKTQDDLNAIHKKHIDKVDDKNVFLSMLTSKKQEINGTVS
jgi:hypothetical protein